MNKKTKRKQRDKKTKKRKSKNRKCQGYTRKARKIRHMRRGVWNKKSALLIFQHHQLEPYVTFRSDFGPHIASSFNCQTGKGRYQI